MNEANRIYDQLRKSYAGLAWHGPALREVLEGIGEEAAARHVGGAHSVRELVRHIAAWEDIAAQTLEGRAYSGGNSLPLEKDWPPQAGSFADELLNLERAQRGLEAAVQSFPDARLDESVPGNPGLSFYVLLHGVIQHHLYHAGQIALLKKELA
mgnify:CR=1 FL=1